MDEEFEQEIERKRQFWAAQPRYRMQCFVAWKMGSDHLKKFLQHDPDTVTFINRQVCELFTLFELPEFKT